MPSPAPLWLVQIVEEAAAREQSAEEGGGVGSQQAVAATGPHDQPGKPRTRNPKHQHLYRLTI